MRHVCLVSLIYFHFFTEETPTVSKNVVQEILSFLEKPNLPATLSDEGVPYHFSQLHV